MTKKRPSLEDIKKVSQQIDHFVDSNKMGINLDNDSPTYELIKALEAEYEWVIDEIIERYTKYILYLESKK